MEATATRDEPGRAGLNESQGRALASALAYIDRLLLDVEAIASAAASRSPFSHYAADLSPTQRQVVADSLARIRARMAEALESLGVPTDGPRVSASWAVQTTLTCAEVTLDDVAPPRLRGYGELSPETAAAVERVEADLARSLRRLRTWLAQGLGRDLAGRLARLERAPVDLTLLRTLERVVTQRGLVELRGALEFLLEQLETGTVEIALFGRVSSGKSSLLNALLGTDLLPVGVTPVTAVPTRVAWGEVPAAEIHFADAPAESVPLERLPEFVSEAGNPGNGKQVVRVVARLPSPRLRAGIVFVDTPGVGSLAASGARESYAYLPRCDLGVVLIDAGSSPSREDLEILRLLYDSGIPGMVVISKADLLGEADRRRLREYVEAEVAGRLGLDVPVHLVSTVGADLRLAQAWFSREIEPLYERARALGEASARRKLAHLREAVVAALRVAVGGDGAERGEAAQQRARIEQLAGEAEAVVGQGGARCRALADRTVDLGLEAIARAARELVRRSAPEAGKRSAETAVRAALLGAAEELCAAVQAELLLVRDRLRAVLVQMAGEIPSPGPRPEELQLDLLSRPTLTVPAEVDGLDLRVPRWLGFSRALLERRLESALHRQLGMQTAQAFVAFGSRLHDWSRSALSRLAEQFAAQAEPLRAYARRLAGADRELGDRAAIAADLREIEAFADQPVSVGSAGREPVP